MSSNRRQSHFTRGGQITFHAIRMFVQINSVLIKVVGWGIVLLSLGLTYLRTPPDTYKAVMLWSRNHLLELFGRRLDSTITTSWNGQKFKSTLAQQLDNEIINDLTSQFFFHFQVNILISSLLGFIAFYLAVKFFSAQGEKQSEDNHIRGFQQGEPKDITREIKAKANSDKKRGYGDGSISSYSLDGHRLFKSNFEVQHLLVDGTTGAGKSVAIRKLLRWIKKRGDKAIIYDKGCTFVGKFYNPHEDFILNPFDERCTNWDVWCDAWEAPDFENIAAAMIPQHGEGDPFWVDSARTIFASTAYRMSQDDKPKTTERLLHLMLTSELETLGSYLKGTESASLVSNKIEKTAISIKSVLATYIKCLRFLDGLDERDESGKPLRAKFSITKWVQDDEKKGVLFLSSNAQQHASLRPLISTWLAIASNAILGMEENPDRRIWVIMDEMPSLHKLPELGSIIAEVRKFGGCFLIGIQSYAQLVKTYGKNAADEMFDLLNTRFYFRAPSYEMAKISSQDLGEQEVNVSRENVSYGANTLRDGVTLGHDIKVRPVFSPSEIQGLDDLQCCIRVPNSQYITKLDLVYDKMKNVAPGFQKREHQLSTSMQALYKQMIYHEIVAPNTLLDDKDKASLASMQSDRYESVEEQKADVDSMKEATQQMQSDTKHSQNETETRKKAAIESEEKNVQETIEREVEESAISQADLGEFAD